jgi:uncharacterized protein involved in exopolysaccharide biosynthesis
MTDTLSSPMRPNVEQRDSAQRERGDAQTMSALLMVLAARYSIVRGAVLAGALVSTLTLLAPRTYTAMASFTPQARRNSTYASSIAAQFGIAGISTGDASQTPQFYVDMLRSPTLLRAVVRRTYGFSSKGGAHAGSLVDLFATSGGSEAIRTENASVSLSRSTRIESSTRTGVVTFWVTTQWPELSKMVADTMLAVLNSYNTTKRQSQAALERRFTESRKDTVLLQLREAEQRLLEFVKANRNYATSPELAVEFDRRSREVQRLQQVFSGLGQAFEQARIDEVRDTPVISIIDDPVVPADADRRRLLVKGFLAVIVGGLMGFALTRVRATGATDTLETSGDVRSMLDEVKAELRSPRATLRRVLTGAQRQRT